MHVGYALIVAASLLRHGRRLLVRALGALYPPFVLLVIVATGNHFFLDAATGAITAAAAAALAALLIRPVTPARLTALPSSRRQLPSREELAA
jgi:membrane-associated phospholipid phosphatase